MSDFLLTYYFWIQSIHVIAAIAWMAGLLYLPRLFVYHAQEEKGSATSETFKTMEYRLLKFIMNPAMIATWVFAILMIVANPDLFSQGWMHVKLTAVILLSGVHGIFSKWRKRFHADQNQKPAKFYKIWNEVPTALMIIIVIMAIAKPF
ncbi:MAG: protoporphyrinogen oxidase HemJ [Pseudomonadota bacterium]